MKKWLLLIFVLLVAGCESQQAKPPSPAKESEPKGHPTVRITLVGGDGSSVEKAVIIKAPSNFIGVRVEYTWIKKNCPGWQLEKQSSFKAGNKIYDKMEFRAPDGRQKTIFFDITDFYGKL